MKRFLPLVLSIGVLTFSANLATAADPADSTTAGAAAKGVTRSSGAGIGEASTRSTAGSPSYGASAGTNASLGQAAAQPAPAATATAPAGSATRSDAITGAATAPSTSATAPTGAATTTSPQESRSRFNTGSPSGVSGGPGLGDTPSTAAQGRDADEVNVRRAAPAAPAASGTTTAPAR